jgi:hypothetical protein
MSGCASPGRNSPKHGFPLVEIESQVLAIVRTVTQDDA